MGDAGIGSSNGAVVSLLAAAIAFGSRLFVVSAVLSAAAFVAACGTSSTSRASQSYVVNTAFSPE